MDSGLSGHLKFLIEASRDVSSDDASVDEWASLQGTSAQHSLVTEQSDSGNYLWESVLDLYRRDPTYNTQSSLLSQLLLKPNAEHMLNSIYSILSSTRSNDEVSGEIVEHVGYEDMELVMEIINNRDVFVDELGKHIRSLSTSGPDHTSDHMKSERSSLAPKNARQRMEQKLRDNAARPLFSGIAGPEAEVLPHVYSSSSMSQGNVLSHLGTRYMLPIGTERQMNEEYEEVVIPPAKPVPPRQSERLIRISDLDPLAKGCFPGYSSLNRIQSIVYPTAYGTNENLLVCAPTGAGKTDVAMLTILRVLDQHRSHSSAIANLSESINRDSFKIIYVAPMKALASEIVRKFEKRLRWLSIKVRELTGDMQMTKAEIAQTQIIVTTPEKWDVVTRKPTGEGEIASTLKLLIIDEVHLLNEERGAVIETIVARTLRQVESTQSVIRIVGLSATLPNYIDVAEFLCASKYKGLFYFDSSFRPVPLEQHFLGIKGKPGSAQAKKNLDEVTFEKVSALVAQGHQVMVFVHARKETVKSAMALKEASMLKGTSDDFSCEDHPQWSFFRRDIGQSRNKEMKELFDHGFGIHHAGMLRSDRNMMERMFEARAIKVLCCTATLAWGVNLPAHAVIIKGTQVYDSSKGAFTDLSVLDVLQVFGRAGRPGMETSGEGYICTSEDKLTHYLEAVISQNPIESQFHKGMIDALNAEIALGTVANINDAIQWLGYTYLFVRMRKNPFNYGMNREVVIEDPQLGSKRNELVVQSAQKLAEARMILFDRHTGALSVTDLGRTAARYYIRYQSIEIFNRMFRPKMSEADILKMLSMSTEFDQIQVRENEIPELEHLMNIVPCDVQGGTDSSQNKVNILLQGYISRQLVDDFALVSDTAYAAQNGGRIVRALLEIAISQKWANASAVLMGISKAIEKRLWPFDQPLKQFSLKADIFYNLETWADDYSPAQLALMSAEELGVLIHLNAKHGEALLNAAKQFPTAKIDYDLRPLGSDVLRIAVRVTRAFTWNAKVHGTSEPFWLWVEDDNAVNILQMSHILFRQSTETVNVDFVISIADGKPPASVTVRFVSDRWMGAEDELVIDLTTLIMPQPSHSNTPPLDLPLLPISTLRDPTVQQIFSKQVHHFNGLQTQMLWTLTKTNAHTLFCAPSGCGKSLMACILMCMTALHSKDSWVLAIAPRRSVMYELLSGLRNVLRTTSVVVEHANGANVLKRPKVSTVRVVLAEELCTVMSSRHPTPLEGLDLVICEDLDQMNAAYELGTSLLRHATQTSPTRFVGVSNSLNDAADLAAWLDVDELALYSFRPTDRGQSLTTSTQTFNIPQSASLFKAMAKPALAGIRGADLQSSAIVFVPSRTQCRSTALDLLTQYAVESQSDRGFLIPDASDGLLEYHAARLKDATLIDFISKGVGFYHDDIHKTDRALMLQLYVEGVIRVLIVPREACWSLPVRAAVVIVMGTQYWSSAADGEERQLREYDLTELVHMQSRAVRHSGSGYFHLFCQSEAKDTYIRFLSEGLPLESKLVGSEELRAWYEEQQKRGNLQNKQYVVDALSFTFLAHRVVTNPAFYDFSSDSRAQNLSWIADQLALGLDQTQSAQEPGPSPTS